MYRAIVITTTLKVFVLRTHIIAGFDANLPCYQYNAK